MVDIPDDISPLIVIRILVELCLFWSIRTTPPVVLRINHGIIREIPTAAVSSVSVIQANSNEEFVPSLLKFLINYWRAT